MNKVLQSLCNDCRLQLMNGDNCSAAVIAVKRHTILNSGMNERFETLDFLKFLLFKLL